MTIQQCKYILEIARIGSFSEAAKQLFIAQSSLSAAVKSLERELNIPIFERSSNGVYLTDEGAEFVRYAKEIVAADELVAKRYSAPKEAEKLFIATQHYDFIADVFGNFVKHTSSDRYRYAIKEIETHNVIREVETAYSDIGIIAIKDGDADIMKRYLNKRNISFTPLLEASPHVFFRRQHPLAEKERLSIGDLKEFPYVSYEQGDLNSSFFTEELTDASTMEKRSEISDRATLMNLLLITDAYTVGTGIMPSALNKGDIVSIPLESGAHYIIGYLLNDSRKVSPMTKRFIAYLEQSIQEMV
jgi:DNA-binding transcriptional LysR family regulator